MTLRGVMKQALRKPAQSKPASFRIDLNLMDRLQQEADLKQISLNTLANQIFKEYVEWYASAPKASYVPVRRSLIVRMLNDLSEEEILDYAKTTAKDSRNINLLLTGKYTLESVLRVIEHKVRISGYQYRRELNDDGKNYVIQHDLGLKWSLYLGALFKAEFEEVGLKNAEFETLENILVFRIKTKGGKVSR